MDEGKTLGDKMSGRLRFPEDAGGKRLLEGVLLRAPVGSGTLVSIELPTAPSGLVSASAADIPGSANASFGSVELPVLASGEILWEGQPVLAAAGGNPAALREWLSRVKLEIEPHESGRPKQTKELLRQKGTPGRAFGKAFQVIEETFFVPPGSPRTGPETVVCLKDGAGYTIHAATAWPGAVRKNVSSVLKVEKNRVRVRTYEPAGRTNRDLWFPAWCSTHAALLASKARRGVRITLPADEMGRFGPGEPGAEFHIRGAVDTEGRILALEADFTVHAGAALPLEEELLERVLLGIFSIYPCRNYVVRGRLEYGSASPSAIGPAAGFELGFLAGELFASRVAEHSLTPPGGWKRHSLPNPGEFLGPGITVPKDFPIRAILNRALAVSDFERRSASFEQTRLGRQKLNRVPEFYRGIGLSCAWFGNGFLASSRELGAASITMTLSKEGELTVDIPSANSAAALQRVWTESIGSMLGIDERTMKFSGEYAPSGTDPGPMILGQDVSVYSRLLEQAADDLAKRRFRDALPITVTRSKHKGGRKTWDSENLEGTPYEVMSWGVGIVEVAISTRTLEIHPNRIWLFIDGGTLLTPDFARSSAESAVEQALNRCIGRSRNIDLPLVDIQFHDTGTRRGSKDVSSIPWLLLPAAVVQAVRQASGVNVDTIPITPERLMRAGS